MRVDEHVTVVTGTRQQINEQLAKLEIQRRKLSKKASKEEGHSKTLAPLGDSPW